MRLAGKKALVTGAARGIGRAIALAFAKEGADVAITARDMELLRPLAVEIEALGRKAHCMVWDITDTPGIPARLAEAKDALGGLDILVNNAGGVRAGRLDNTTEADIEQMVIVDLLAPVLLTRAALPALRASGDAMVVNVASGIALVGAPFYATYAAVKAGLARFGEALRRELKGEGIHVLTAYPGGTDTPMMKSNRAGPELGFSREPASAVADAIVAGIEANAFEVIRGGEARAQMIALNRNDPVAVDARFLTLKSALEEAVKDHSAL